MVASLLQLTEDRTRDPKNSPGNQTHRPRRRQRVPRSREIPHQLILGSVSSHNYPKAQFRLKSGVKQIKKFLQESERFSRLKTAGQERKNGGRHDTNRTIHISHGRLLFGCGSLDDGVGSLARVEGRSSD